MTSTDADGTSPAGSSDQGETGEGQSFIARLRAVLRRRRGPSIRASLTDSLDDPEQAQEAFSPEERAMLRNILGLREQRVDDIMVPRADIVAVAEETSIGDLLTVFREAGHSRLPVYRGTLDDPSGMVHIKDLVSFLLSGAALTGQEEGAGRRRRRSAALQHLSKVDFSRPLSSAAITRPALFVPPSKPAMDLLVKMQATRIHMALVIDEHGGTDGLVTIEDLVEQVVGEIEDEHDFDEAPLVTRKPNGGYVADARAPLDEVGAAIGFDLRHGQEAEEVDTLGGLIVTLAGRVPVRGEVIAGPGEIDFEILEADTRRIRRVGLHRRAQPAVRSAAGLAGKPPPEPDHAKPALQSDTSPQDLPTVALPGRAGERDAPADEARRGAA